MDCPSCSTTLTMSERHGIEIDYCPKCRGVWLDRGELDKIIERASADAAVHAPPARHAPAHHGGYHAPYSPKKKESFLSDVFDF